MTIEVAIEPPTEAFTVGARGRVRISETPVTVAALAILAVAFALRLFLLGDKDVLWDEAISAWTARSGFGEIAIYQAGAVHPPLHYWFLHIWSTLVGQSEFALRASSVLFGVLAIALLYRIGARFVSRPVGLLAALLLAVSRFHVWWSQEIRMYALATLLTLLSLYGFLGVLQRHGKLVAVTYWLSTVLLLYTLYLGVLTVLAQNIIVLALLIASKAPRSDRIARLRTWVLLQLAVLVLYLPWLTMMMRYAGHRTADEPGLEPLLYSRIYATVLALGVDTNIERYTLTVLAVGALAFCSLFVVRRRRPLIVATTAIVYVIVPPAMIYLLSLPQYAFYTPAVNARYFLLFIPAWYLFLAISVIEWIRLARWLGLGLVIGVLLTASYFTPSYFQDRFRGDDYPTLSETIRAFAQPGDAIVLNPDTDWPIFLYHYRGSLPWIGLPHAERITESEVESLMAPAWTTHTRIWLVTTEKALGYDPDGRVQSWLMARGQKVIDREFGQQRVALYARPGEAPKTMVPGAGTLPQTRLDRDLVDGITLLGYDRWLPRADTGRIVRFALWWRAGRQAHNNYGLQARLTDAAGKVAMQRSWPTVDNAVPSSARSPENTYRGEYSWPIAADIPTGRYHWQVTLTDPMGVPVGDSAPLGDLSIVQTRQPRQGEDIEVAYPLGARFGDEIELVGFGGQSADSRPNLALSPGEDLALTLLWRPLNAVEHSYTVFVHILGTARNKERDNLIWGQIDAVPGNGSLPTTSWTPGEFVSDQYRVRLDSTAQHGEYQIELGMYERTSGRRLPIALAGHPTDDHIFLGTISVR